MVDVPRYAVLWHYTNSDGWKVVWLCDYIKDAEFEAAKPRPAMEPGEAVIVSLEVIGSPKSGAS